MEEGSTRKRPLSTDADNGEDGSGSGLGEAAPGPPTCYRKCNFDEGDLRWDYDEDLGGDAAGGEPRKKRLNKNGEADLKR